MNKSMAAVGSLVVVAALAACGGAAGQANGGHAHPAPAEATAAPADTGKPRGSEADARFMRGMIAHHAQALEMTALVPARSGRDDVKLLAARIEASQQGEIELMRRWLRAHGHDAPAADAHQAHGAGGHATMPGMLAPEEMARLAAASGAEFDRLFLDFMIRHHDGALAMVAELFGTPGAAQATDVFRLASDVDADQRAEIARMRRLREGPISGAPPR